MDILELGAIGELVGGVGERPIAGKVQPKTVAFWRDYQRGRQVRNRM